MAKNRDFSKFPNAITVLDNGNVGIGVTSPNSLLHILGTTPAFTLTDNAATGNNGNVSIRAEKVGIGYNNLNYVGYQHIFKGGGSESTFLTINSAGSLLIGTTSDNGTGKLQVINSSAGWGGQITNGSGQQVLFAHGGGYGLNVNAGSNASSSTYLAAFVSNGLDRFYISGDGKVGVGTASPGSKMHLYDGTNPISLKIQRTSVPVYLSDVQPAGTTAASCWSHNVESTSNGSPSWGGFTNGSYAGSAIMLNANTGNSWITFLAAPSANTNPTERFRIFGTNGYSNAYKYIGNISSTSLSSLSDAQVQRWYFESPCNNTWRALVASINQRHFFVRIWGSDAGTYNYGEYYFTMSFPGYGVSSSANLHYTSGGWNTGGFELSYTNTGSDYYLIFRNTSYYSSSNNGTYLIEITAA